jgi:hypothetical protein
VKDTCSAPDKTAVMHNPTTNIALLVICGCISVGTDHYTIVKQPLLNTSDSNIANALFVSSSYLRNLTSMNFTTYAVCDYLGTQATFFNYFINIYNIVTQVF